MNKDYLQLLTSKSDPEILSEFALGKHGQPESQLRKSVEDFMRARRSANESISSEKQERREEKTILIAEEANSIAREALSIKRKNERWAMYAAIIATVAVIIAAMAYIKTP